jgi:hypothetical protein
MTKKLEEEFNLPPIEDIDIPLDAEDEEITLEEAESNIVEYQVQLDLAQRTDAALPMVTGLEELDREMDEYAAKAIQTFDELVDLGKNVEDRNAAPVFDSASKMLTAALQAKQAKMDKKLKMLELQMRQRKLDMDERKLEHQIKSKQDDENDPEEIEGKFVNDRASMLSEIMSQMKQKDK